MLIKTEWTFRLLCYNNPSQKQAAALCCDCTICLCFLSLLCQLSNKFIVLRLKRSNDANVLRFYSTRVDSMFPERESSEAHCSFPSRWCWSYFHWFLGNPPLCPSEEHVKEYFRAASQPWPCSWPCCVLSIRNWILPLYHLCWFVLSGFLSPFPFSTSCFYRTTSVCVEGNLHHCHPSPLPASHHSAPQTDTPVRKWPWELIAAPSRSRTGFFSPDELFGLDWGCIIGGGALKGHWRWMVV